MKHTQKNSTLVEHDLIVDSGSTWLHHIILTTMDDVQPAWNICVHLTWTDNIH